MSFSILSRGRRPGRAHPRVERLEDRSLLSLTGLLPTLLSASPPTTLLSRPAQSGILPASVLNLSASLGASQGNALGNVVNLVASAEVALSLGATKLTVQAGVQTGNGIGIVLHTSAGAEAAGAAASLVVSAGGSLATPGVGGSEILLRIVENSPTGHLPVLGDGGSPSQGSAANSLLVLGEASPSPAIKTTTGEAGGIGDGIGNLDQGPRTAAAANPVLIGTDDVAPYDPIIHASLDYTPIGIYQAADQLTTSRADGSPETALSPGQTAESLAVTGDIEAAWLHFLSRLQGIGASAPFWHSVLGVAPWLFGMLIVGFAFEIARRRQQRTLRGLALGGVCGVALGDCYPELSGLSLPK
jgi:hypothetical protein